MTNLGSSLGDYSGCIWVIVGGYQRVGKSPIYLLGVKPKDLQPSQTRRNNNNESKLIQTTSIPQEHKVLRGKTQVGEKPQNRRENFTIWGRLQEFSLNFSQNHHSLTLFSLS